MGFNLFKTQRANTTQQNSVDVVKKKQDEKNKANQSALFDEFNKENDFALEFQKNALIGKQDDSDISWKNLTFENRVQLISSYVSKIPILSNIINDYANKIKAGDVKVLKDSNDLSLTETEIIKTLFNRNKMNNHNAFDFETLLQTVNMHQWLCGEYFIEWDCTFTKTTNIGGEVSVEMYHPYLLRILNPQSYMPFQHDKYNIVNYWERINTNLYEGTQEKKEKYGQVRFYRHFPGDYKMYGTDSKYGNDTPFASNIYKTQYYAVGDATVDEEGNEIVTYHQSFLMRSTTCPYGSNYSVDERFLRSTIDNPLGYYADMITGEHKYLNGLTIDDCKKRGYSKFYDTLPLVNKMLCIMNANKPLVTREANIENIVVANEETLDTLKQGLKKGMPSLFGKLLGKTNMHDDKTNKDIFSSPLQQNSGKLKEKETLLYELEQQMRTRYGLATQEYNIDPKFSTRDTSAINFLNNVKDMGSAIIKDINNFLNDTFLYNDSALIPKSLIEISYEHFPLLLKEKIATMKSITATAPVLTTNEIREDLGYEKAIGKEYDMPIINFQIKEGTATIGGESELDDDTAREQKKKTNNGDGVRNREKTSD